MSTIRKRLLPTSAIAAALLVASEVPASATLSGSQRVGSIGCSWNPLGLWSSCHRGPFTVTLICTVGSSFLRDVRR
jgi:hypothetical protein